MSPSPKRGRGRPTKPAEVRKRNNLTIRVRDALKANLETQASRHQRSLSEEAENRLDRSFDRLGLLTEALGLAFGKEAGGIALLAAIIMTRVGRQAAHERVGGFKLLASAKAAERWMDEPFTYEQARLAVDELLRAARPVGESKYVPKSKRDKWIDATRPQVISGHLVSVLKDPSHPMAELFDYISEAREMLGPAFIDRLRPINFPPEPSDGNEGG